MKIFSGSSNPLLTQKIADALNLQISPLDIHIFPDGEKRVRVIDKVVSEKTVVVAPTSPPVDANYMELFFIIDALKRSGAEYVTAVVPYLGYQRQDHVFRDGEAVSLEVIIETLKSTGIKEIIAVDLHSSRIPDVFTFPIKHVSALPLFAEQIKSIMQNELSSTENKTHNSSFIQHNSNIILVTPDMGGIRRIKMLSEMLDNMPYAAIEKNRDLNTGVVSADTIGEGSVENKKTAIIIDDMIASGNTIITAEEVLKSRGVEEMYVFATHAIFNKETPKILETSRSRKIFVTDSVLVEEDKKFHKLEIISIADIIAQQLLAAE